MKRVADKMTEKIELSGFALAKSWFYLNPTEGVNVFNGEYEKNNYSTSKNYTKVVNSKINIENQIYDVIAFVHTHNSSSPFSGYLLYKGYSEETCLGPCDRAAFTSKSWLNTGIRKWILLSIDGDNSKLHLARIKKDNKHEVGVVTSFKNFIRKNATFNNW
jgi:hypothetical protein